MNILSYKPDHDGSIAYLRQSRLLFSIEAEKNSNYRYSPIFVPDMLNALGELDELPEVICTGGWWPREAESLGGWVHAGYRGLHDIIIEKRRLFGRPVNYFSSSHERSHVLCAFGLSTLPKGTPCYVLVWEGSIGSFYEINDKMNISGFGDVMNEPGHRYALLYGLADPSFNKNGAYSQHSDAGKLMALASYGTRKTPSVEEQKVIAFLLQDCVHLEPRTCNALKNSPYFNIGVDNPDFCNLAGIFSDKLFDIFYQFAKANLNKRLPLIIAGGCGLNCDWNTKWKETKLFSEIFVPPVANDSGSAIGTAIDAQLHFTGNPKIDWEVYSGLGFGINFPFDESLYDSYDVDDAMIAKMLAKDLILGWVNGKYEIGPRALGNRSILAAPFRESTRRRLNEIKQREQFRPIAPVCLEEDAARWFGCHSPSPHMLYTYTAITHVLAAVTHVNKTARIQTVSRISNQSLYNLLVAFKECTGYGVLCNTSLNFKNRGFINKIDDLSKYAITRNLDGFVVNGRSYLLKSSTMYREYLRTSQIAIGVKITSVPNCVKKTPAP
jgi:predicted NodU family carbamoyl transferase